MNKKSWWEKIQGRFFVWTWSNKYYRYVNTHVYENQRDAELTVGKKKAPVRGP